MSMWGQALAHFVLVATVLYGAVGLLTALLLWWRRLADNNNDRDRRHP